MEAAKSRSHPGRKPSAPAQGDGHRYAGEKPAHCGRKPGARESLRHRTGSRHRGQRQSEDDQRRQGHPASRHPHRHALADDMAPSVPGRHVQRNLA